MRGHDTREMEALAGSDDSRTNARLTELFRVGSLLVVTLLQGAQ